MFDGNRRVLGVGHQLAGGPGVAAQFLENVQMVGAGPNYMRIGAFHEGRHKGEGLVEGCGWVEDPRISHHAEESGQNEDGQGEGFRASRQASDPVRILLVIVGGVFNVGVDEDVYVG